MHRSDKYYGGTRTLFVAYLNILNRNDFENAVLNILSRSKEQTLSKQKIKEISLKKIESKWETLKKGGITTLPSGDASIAYDELNKKLEGIGIFMVPERELECFVKQVGGYGPAWTDKVLETYLNLNDEVYSSIKEFVKMVCDLT